MAYQALAPNHAPAELVFFQPVSEDYSLYKINDVPSSFDTAAIDTLPAISIAQAGEILLAEPAGPSVHVLPHPEDPDDLPTHAHINPETDSDTLELQNVLLSSQSGSYAPDAGVDRCDLKAPQLAKPDDIAHS